jgi:sRNA-binding carbon storage regulator CsrA
MGTTPRGKLIVRRRLGEEVWIDGTLIKIHKIDGQWIKLYIEADKTVKILRGEQKAYQDQEKMSIDEERYL